MNYDEMVVCEAGFLSRRVFARLEAKINPLLKAGWRIRNRDITDTGIIRSKFIVVLEKPK